MFPSLRCVPLAVAAALVFAAVAPAQEETAEAKIRRGNALHDQGKYPEAIKVYREVLQQDQRNALALYELAFSLNAYGDYTECAATGERALEHAKTYRIELFRVTGTCYDHAGQGEKAVKVFKKGRQEFPQDSLLAYNFAVTQIQQKNLRAARELAKAAIDSEPSHASSYRVLAFAYDGDGYDIPSLLAALRFLSLEPTGQRAPDVARLVKAKLFGGVSQDPDKQQINVVIQSDAPNDEGDFKITATFLGLISAANFLPDEAKKPESERVAAVVKGLLEHLGEEPGPSKLDPIVKSRLVEPLAAIHRTGLAEAFGYLAFYSLDLEGGKAWLEAHPDQKAALVQHLRQSAAGG